MPLSGQQEHFLDFLVIYRLIILLHYYHYLSRKKRQQGIVYPELRGILGGNEGRRANCGRSNRAAGDRMQL